MSPSRRQPQHVPVERRGAPSAHLIDLRAHATAAADDESPAALRSSAIPPANFLPTVYAEHRREHLRRATAFFFIALLLLVGLKTALSAPEKIAVIKAHLLQRLTPTIGAALDGATALSNGQFAEAHDTFTSVHRNFDELTSSFGRLGTFTATIARSLPIVGAEVGSSVALVDVGKDVSSAAAAFSEGAAELPALLGGRSLPEGGRVLREALRNTKAHLAHAAAGFATVDVHALPASLQAPLQTFGQELNAVVAVTDTLPERVDLVMTLLGHTRTMRYLVAFENNAELRPAGGFFGSFALMDLDRGKIVRLEIPGGGTYDLRAGLPFHLRSPEPLQKLRAQWEFQDTNWFPDWPTSAQTMITFYEKSGGPTVDGAIAITTSFFEDLLGVVGPVDVPERGGQITAENAFLSLQSEVESTSARATKKPKTVLGLVAPRILERLFSTKRDAFPQVLSFLERAVEARHLQIYVKDQALRAGIEQAGLGGQMRENPHGDYLSMVSANIGGGKSDRVIQDAADLTLTVSAAGTLQQTLRFRRTHAGRPGAPFVGVTNISYLRFYVPAGSVLLSAKGFTPSLALMKKSAHEEDQAEPVPLQDDLRVQERAGAGSIDPVSRTRITSEFGKTVFGNWLVVDPGNTAEVELTYQLPFTVPPGDALAPYTLLVQKQAGKVGDTISFHVVLPSNGSILWGTSDALAEPNPVSVPLDRDRIIGMLLKV